MWYDINPNLPCELNLEAFEAIKIVTRQTMLPNINLETLFEQVYCEENAISGDFVECGVWKGGAMGSMTLTNLIQDHAEENCICSIS